MGYRERHRPRHRPRMASHSVTSGVMSESVQSPHPYFSSCPKGSMSDLMVTYQAREVKG